MAKTKATKANDSVRPGQPLGSDRLLGISDVAEIFQICEPKASELMKLSGHHIVYARKSISLRAISFHLSKSWRSSSDVSQIFRENRQRPSRKGNER